MHEEVWRHLMEESFILLLRDTGHLSVSVAVENPPVGEEGLRRENRVSRVTEPALDPSSPGHRAWLTTKGPVSQDDVSASGLGEGGIF